ncbi:MAG: FAD-dependent oxidoreductase [Sandaracinaceae bacterium]|nr:FAD-dependent oxidoreductase [Myxococcales bacterium]MCB9661146.1 FAD-dependent oxidoreductase [Sandaracinaceae bacterium]
MHVVIVGNGVAGMEAALTVRALDPHAKVTLVSEESDHFFSRTALMWVASGQMSHRDIEPLERDAYPRRGLERLRARAVGVDVERSGLRLLGGETLSYDRLLIACGSRPRPGPWPGSDLRGVGHFVTLQDLEWYEAELHGGPSHAGGPPRADQHLAACPPDSPYRRREVAARTRGSLSQAPAVIGGGLIGIEAVEVAHARGLHPRFFIRDEWFWPMAIDAAEAGWITERMRAHGVHVHLEHEVERLEGDAHGNVARVVTDRGSYDADCAVIAIGVVPNTAWLSGSGVALDHGGGVIVDAQQRTNVPNVYAAGDCASVRWVTGAQRPEQLWYTGRDQGRVAARALLGDTGPRATYARPTWYNSAKLMDIEYTTVGLVNMQQPGEREWFFEERSDVRSTTRIVYTDAGVIGFNMLGRRWDHSVLAGFIDQGRSLTYALEHLHEAAFDTELVPPLVLPKERGPHPEFQAH